MTPEIVDGDIVLTRYGTFDLATLFSEDIIMAVIDLVKWDGSPHLLRGNFLPQNSPLGLSW